MTPFGKAESFTLSCGGVHLAIERDVVGELAFAAQQTRIFEPGHASAHVRHASQASIVMMSFELWDAELGLCLGSYASLGEAFAAVRRLLDSSRGSTAPLGLVEVEDQQRVIATGDRLIELACSRTEVIRSS